MAAKRVYYYYNLRLAPLRVGWDGRVGGRNNKKEKNPEDRIKWLFEKRNPFIFNGQRTRDTAAAAGRECNFYRYSYRELKDERGRSGTLNLLTQTIFMHAYLLGKMCYNSCVDFHPYTT